MGADEDYEWIELYNYGKEKINLDGWVVNGVEISGHIEPHAYFIVARQDKSDPDENGEYFSVYYNPDREFDIKCEIFDAWGAELGLGNNSGFIELVNNEGELVDFVEYTRHDGMGHTLEKICPFVESGEDRWYGSEEERAFGTPDYQNSRLILNSELELAKVGEEWSREFQYFIAFMNKTPFEDMFSSWGVITHLETERSMEFPFEEVHLGPYEEKVFEGGFKIPAHYPSGMYLLTIIAGTDDTHSFAPENEEFSVLAASPPNPGNSGTID